MNKIEILPHLCFYDRKIEIFIRSGKSYADPLVFRELDEGAMMRPTLKIEYEDGQSLIDSLWTCGLRPSEGSGSAGSLKATERHLEDMRNLVFTPPPHMKPEDRS